MNHRAPYAKVYEEKNIAAEGLTPYRWRDTQGKSLYRDLFSEDGFLRLAFCHPETAPGDLEKTLQTHLHQAQKAIDSGADLIVFPALSLTGLTSGSWYQGHLTIEILEDLLTPLAELTARCPVALLVSCPLQVQGKRWHGLALLSSGAVQAFIPLDIPTQHPFLSSFSAPPVQTLRIPFGGLEIPILGDDLRWEGFRLASLPNQTILPFCADAQTYLSHLPQFNQALALNFCCQPTPIHSEEQQQNWCIALSQMTHSTVGLVNACGTESTSQGVYTGQSFLAQTGGLLGSSLQFEHTPFILDMDWHRHLLPPALPTLCEQGSDPGFLLPITPIQEKKGRTPLEKPSPLPFLPTSDEGSSKSLFQQHEDWFQLLVGALGRRVQFLHYPKLVLGLSGGLDSALALLICIRTQEAYSRPLEDIHCLLMPGMASSSRTGSNAEKMAQFSSVSHRSISIIPSVQQHLKDLGHDGQTPDTTYENAQARERTQILMDYANQVQGIVIGTGDLSEAALGWCTYNGDQMSMYNVNASLPKTLIRSLCQHEAERLIEKNPSLSSVLLDILSTPVSPELVPGQGGQIAQETESIIGPYELHDFFLYHLVGLQESPAKTRRLALLAFQDQYDSKLVTETLKLFIRRFIQNQFKRSASPDGAEVGWITLSAKAGFVLPSDLSPAYLLQRLAQDERLYPEA